ncbi:hypothetical protein DFH09DRAFT_1304445 [Mycena vulgaris]|nr:hypothetical protein DFH09DRAFT_1304445 [Mycena vulgaris]
MLQKLEELLQLLVIERTLQPGQETPIGLYLHRLRPHAILSRPGPPGPATTSTRPRAASSASSSPPLSPTFKSMSQKTPHGRLPLLPFLTPGISSTAPAPAPLAALALLSLLAAVADAFT